MNFAVLQFPGSNCDQDVVHVPADCQLGYYDIVWLEPGNHRLGYLGG